MDNIENVERLSAAYLNITAQVLVIEQLISSDELPLYLPNITELTDKEKRQIAIESIGRVRAGESSVESGLLCVSNETKQAVEQLNQFKDQFKAEVKSIKDSTGATSRGIENLIQSTANITRDETLSNALRSIGELSLDLRSCYAHVRVLPKNLISVSWTWAMKHKRMKNFTVAEALALAEKIVDEDAKQAAIIDLKQLTKDARLIQKYDMPPQLKANIQYIDDNGELIKKAITVSGLLIAQQVNLPKLLWRDKPDHVDRMERPKLRDEELFVPTLSMYRHV